MADELTRWKQQQAQDKQRAGDKYTDDGFIVTNEFGHYFEQKTFKDSYDRLLKDADIGHFTFHALRHPYVCLLYTSFHRRKGRDCFLHRTAEIVRRIVYIHSKIKG